jgi:large subunit ribosomal protein L28
MLEKNRAYIKSVNPDSYMLNRENTMAKCAICGKSIQIGNNVSHSNKKTKKIWRPNIKKIRVLEDKRTTRKYVCTRCIRSGKITKAI